MTIETRLYKFDNFLLNPAKRTLTYRNESISLGGNHFDLLLFLVESAPKACSHDDIIEAVWGHNVENNSIEKAVGNLRAVLGDDKKNPRFIKTVRTKGYLFVGDLKEHTDLPDNHAIERGGTANSATYRFGLKFKVAVSSAALVLLVGIIGISFWKGREAFGRLGATTIFSDDFSGDALDSTTWESMGNAVRLTDGILRLSVEETDNPGLVYSKYFTVDPTKKMTINSRIKISFSRNMKNETYFGGVFGFIQKTDRLDGLAAHQDTDAENSQFTGLRYMNYDSEKSFAGYQGEALKEAPTEGFFVVKDGGRPNARSEYQTGKISERIEPIWDRWFEQKIEYDPVSGQMVYFTDGEKKGEFNVGRLKAKDNQIRLLILPWGWWVNHSMEIDYILVSQ